MGRAHQLSEAAFCLDPRPLCACGGFCPAGSSNSLVSAPQGCAGLSVVLAKGTAGSQLLSQAGRCFSICVRAHIPCQSFPHCNQVAFRVPVVFPWSQQQEPVLSLAVTPGAPRAVLDLGNSVLVPIPSSCVRAGTTELRPLVPRRAWPPPRVPPWQLPARCSLSPPAPGLSGNGTGGEGPRRAQQ